MSLTHARRRVNLVFFLWTSVLFVAVIGLLVLGYQSRSRSTARSWLDQAEQAEKSGDLPRAERLMFRYLRLVPTDRDARVRYARLITNLDRSSSASRQAVLIMEEVLRDSPGDNTIRREVADHLLVLAEQDQARATDALEHLTILNDVNPNQPEIESRLGRAEQLLRHFTKAAGWFAKAIQHDPEDVETASILATMTRDEIKDPKQAELLINAMVDNNPRSGKALLLRHQFRRGTLSANVNNDLEAAYKLEPNNLEIALAWANWQVEEGRLDQARAALQRFVESPALDPRPYVATALLEIRAGRPAEAETRLRDGLRRLPNNPELIYRLANTLIEQGKLREAEQQITALKAGGIIGPPVEFLECRLLVGQEKWTEAVGALETLRAALSGGDLSAEVDALLAVCHGRLDQPEQRIEALRRLAARGPGQSMARLAYAQALRDAGKAEEATQEFRVLADLVPEARLELIRGYLAQPERISSLADGLKTIERWLDELARMIPENPDVPLLRAEAALRDARAGEAAKILETETSAHPNRPEPVVALAAMSAASGDIQRAEELLRRLPGTAESQQTTAKLLAQARVWAAAPRDIALPRLRELEADAKPLSPTDRESVLRAIALAFDRMGATTDAESVWSNLARLYPARLAYRLRLLEIALESEKPERIATAIEAVHAVEGNTGINWKLGELYLSLLRAEQGETGALQDIPRRLGELTGRSAITRELTWINAEAKRLSGKTEEAIAGYRQLIASDYRVPSASRRLIGLLTQAGRLSEVMDLIKSISAIPGAPSLNPRTIVGEYLSANDFSRAVAMARSAVESRPDELGERLWLAAVEEVCRDRKAAESTYLKLLEKFPDRPEGYVAFCQFLVNAGRPQEAATLLERIRTKVPSESSPIAVAECLRILGRGDEARELLTQAVKLAPEDPQLLRKLSESAIEAGRLEEAERLLNSMLQLKFAPRSEDEAWARRSLAIILSSRKATASKSAALGLIEQNLANSPDSLPDQRLQAILLAAQPLSRKSAVTVLRAIDQSAGLSLEELLLLLNLLELTRDFRAFEEVSIRLRSEPNLEATTLGYLAENALRQSQRESASYWIDRLSKLEPSSFRTVSLRARLLTLEGHSDQAVELVKQVVAKEPAETLGGARVLESIGELREAEVLYRAAIRIPPFEDAVAELGRFYSEQNRPKEMLTLWTYASRQFAPDVVAAITVRLTSGSAIDPATLEVIRGGLAALLEKNSKSVLLRLALAQVLISLDHAEDAESVYRQILTIEPKSTDARNNLAWLLSWKQIRMSEAESLIRSVIAEQGELPSFLDTLAIGLANQGDFASSIRLLNRVLDAEPTAARFFHLAWVLARQGDRSGAAKAMQKARAAGLAVSGLDGLERKAMEWLNLQPTK